MITLAANNPTLGGGEKMLLELADALRCSGRAVTVVAPEAPGDMVAASRDRDFPTVALPASDRPGYLRALRRWDARQREGLLWCGGLVPGLATAGHPNRILHLHQLPQGLHQAVYRISRTGVRAVVVPSQTMARLPILGTPGDVVSALTYTGATVVIFAEGSFPRAHMFNEMARVLENHHARMIVVPALSDISSQRMRVRPVAGMPLVHVEHPRATKAGTWAKRAFDIAGALLFITLAAPVMIATALAIKLEDGGPIFFKQKRVGRKGQEFNFIKFRSMRVDAEAQLQALSASNESTTGVLFKMAKDPRVTRVGRFIRRYSIDEIPQFVNVLRGDMSLVGPRPALPSEVRKYEVHVLRRLDVRPGMTGLWQVSGRSNLSWDDTVRLDLFYVDNWSLLQDISILVKTTWAVFGSSGAY